MGLLRPRMGEIRFEGQSLARTTPDKRARMGIGYVPQGREVIPRLTVRENLLIGQEALGTRGKPVKEVPQSIYELFPGAGNHARPHGRRPEWRQQQQLAIAEPLWVNPKLLVLDEPTEGIQPSIILDIEAAVKRIIKNHWAFRCCWWNSTSTLCGRLTTTTPCSGVALWHLDRPVS